MSAVLIPVINCLAATCQEECQLRHGLEASSNDGEGISVSASFDDR